MQKIVFFVLVFFSVFVLVSCTETVEAPVVVTPDTSLSGSSAVVGQDIINQIGEITQEVEGKE